jgi:amidase
VQRILREQSKKYAFNWMDAPLLKVQPGEVFEIETYDAGSGYFKSSEDKPIPALRPGFNRSPPLVNPIAGPVWVEGAERGDSVEVSIEAITVGEQSWTASGPGRGTLGESTRWRELSSEYHTKILRHSPGPGGTMRDGVIHFNECLNWPITPFIGTFGVAPDREVTTSADGQGAWGGNLDIRHAAPGSRLYLPVLHPGALLYVGDVHASQGDGEFSGTAAETCATVQLKCGLIKGRQFSGIRINTPRSRIAVGIARPLESAVESAIFGLMDSLINEGGLSPTDAYCLVSTCPDFRIHVYQMLRPSRLHFVAGAELPEAYFESQSV